MSRTRTNESGKGGGATTRQALAAAGWIAAAVGGLGCSSTPSSAAASFTGLGADTRSAVASVTTGQILIDFFEDAPGADCQVENATFGTAGTAEIVLDVDPSSVAGQSFAFSANQATAPREGKATMYFLPADANDPNSPGHNVFDGKITFSADSDASEVKGTAEGDGDPDRGPPSSVHFSGTFDAPSCNSS